MNAVLTELARNKEIRSRVETSRESVRILQSEKIDLLMAYFDIILEHHHSIAVLIEHNHAGSAFALVRPSADTLFRALWVNACATPAQISEILRNDAFAFPRDMMASIDTAYATQSFFQSFKRASWAAMCSYTHSGLLQVLRRLDSDGGVGGGVGSNYSEIETTEVLKATSGLLLLTAILFFRACGFEEKAADMEALVPVQALGTR
jgi:hypothetical protein